ncbi:MAG: type I 3-dehydroquinate dehydratase [Ruminococcaceae bacterium]|nr:type I 3-dehydroquinate dehydratase [Oscillospiraceae bacterium]
MKPTFIKYGKPLVTCMVQAKTPLDVKILIRNALYDGADAIGFQIEELPKECRDDDTLRAIFDEARGRPVYVTNYRSANNKGDSDDTLCEGLLQMLRNGATLIDVMADCFCPDPLQITYDTEAVKKQKAFIDKIHSLGGEVLMSTHTGKFLPPEEVLAIARAQAERGADIIKIVITSNSEDEELSCLATTELLRRELDRPFLFLAAGTNCSLLRQIGPYLGSSMWLTVQRHDELSTKYQPLCRSIRAIADNFVI